ncbi:MAG: DMT family transporter [Polyangiaceae bacterium]
MERPRLAAAGFVLVASAAFSTAGPLARAARPADPLFVAAARVLLAAVLLGLLDVRGVARDVRALPWKVLGKIFLVGALLGAHFALFLCGLDRTSLPAGISLVSLEPLSVVVWAWLLFRERPSRAEQVGVLLATAGAVVVAQGAGQGEHRLFGDLLVVGSVMLFGLYVASARALRDVLPARTYAAVVYACAAVSLLAVMAVLPAPEGTTRAPGGMAWLAIAGVALIPTVIGHTAVQTAARSLPPATVALVSPGETLGGIAISLVVLGARPKPLELLGAAIILVGSMVAILAIRPRPVAGAGAEGAGEADAR